MSLPVFPLPRGAHWAVHKVQKWSTLKNMSTSGGQLNVPLYPNNPLWSWEWSYEVILDDTSKLSYKTAPNNNTLYTDLQIMEAFYFKVRGGSDPFAYQPPDTAIVGQVLATPDANGNSELIHTIGAIPGPSGLTVITEAVQELNGGTPTIHHTGGAFSVLAAGSTPPYEGIVIHWSSLPTGTVTADFNYFYRCTFSEDSQDYEQFSFNLWQLQSLKYEQIRITSD